MSILGQTRSRVFSAAVAAVCIGMLACGQDPTAAQNTPVDDGLRTDEELLNLDEQSTSSAALHGPSRMGRSIVEIAQSNPNFSILVAAAVKADFVELLSNTRRDFTVFAPTNQAFTNLLGALGITNGLDGLSKEQLQTILAYHVVPREIRAQQAIAAARQNAKVSTLGGSIALSLAGNSLKIDQATVVTPDVIASNGVIHAIDSVLLPSITDVVVSNERFGALERALVAADPQIVALLDNDAGGKFTVFAPTNRAFANLIRALRGDDFGFSTGIRRLRDFTPGQLLPVLKYHVIAGSQILAAGVPTARTAVTTLGGSIRAQRTGSDVSIDAAKVTTADILTSNGVIHVIDSVLLPSITDVASTDSRYTGLLGAVGSAGGGLAGVLDDDAAKFTIFAPSNDAFSKVTLPPNASLLNVLLYHAVPNAVVYENQARFLFRAQVPTALMNKTLEITGFHGITIKDSTPVRANVTQGDTFTSNGVIHQIDKVLLP